MTRKFTQNYTQSNVTWGLFRVHFRHHFPQIFFTRSIFVREHFYKLEKVEIYKGLFL